MTGAEVRHVGPAGWAELYVSAYLSAGSGSEADLKAFYPGTPPLDGEQDAFRATRAAAIGMTRIYDAYWSVTVAVDVTAEDRKGDAQPIGLRFYRVGVVADRSGGSAAYRATSLPSLVGRPGLAGVPSSPYGGRPLQSDDPAIAALGHFFEAYLAGRGELVRYLAPGAGMTPVKPSPFAKVEIIQAVPRGLPPARREGARMDVLTDVRAVDTSDRVQRLSYAVQLLVRDGRWVIARTEPAPLIVNPGEGGVRP